MHGGCPPAADQDGGKYGSTSDDRKPEFGRAERAAYMPFARNLDRLASKVRGASGAQEPENRSVCTICARNWALRPREMAGRRPAGEMCPKWAPKTSDRGLGPRRKPEFWPNSVAAESPKMTPPGIGPRTVLAAVLFYLCKRRAHRQSSPWTLTDRKLSIKLQALFLMS